MSDTGLLLVLVALNLLFASALALVRLTAVGWPVRQVLVMIAEMWGVFGLFIGMFRFVLGKRTDSLPPGLEAAAELSEFAARLASLGPGDMALFVGAVVLTVGLFFHMLMTLNRAMHRAPPEA